MAGYCHYAHQHGRLAVFSGTLLLLMGCGNSDGLNRIPLYGKVSGAEGRSGSLTLVPQAGTSAPAATVPIIDGAYRFTKMNGPVPGNYEAIIAFTGTATTAPPAAELPSEDDKVVEFTRRQGRTFASFDVGVEETRVAVTVSEEAPLEYNLDLP